MPRFMSPLRPRYMRSPSDIPQEGLKITPTPQQAETSSANANNESQEQQEPEYPEIACVSEGTFRQIRDDSLVLLSQGISHRLLRSFTVSEGSDASVRDVATGSKSRASDLSWTV